MNVEVSDTSSDQTGESEIVQLLKNAFHASTKKRSSPSCQIVGEDKRFGATDYMVRRAKALALTQRAVEQVKELYIYDGVSRVMPCRDERFCVSKKLFLKINIKNNRQFNLQPNTFNNVHLASMYSFQLLMY